MPLYKLHKNPPYYCKRWTLNKLKQLKEKKLLKFVLTELTPSPEDPKPCTRSPRRCSTHEKGTAAVLRHLRRASLTRFHLSGEKRRRSRAPTKKRTTRTATAIPPARTGSSVDGRA